MEGAHNPFVSVIIPVFNDRDRLGLCLAALAQQTYGRLHFEVIVVDNGSDRIDDIQALAESYAGVVFAQELTPGSYAARNKGISLAQGDIIAFTDADCIPAPDWIECGVHQLNSQGGCGMVVGRVEVFPESPEDPTLFEIYQMVAGFSQEQCLHQFKGGATANVLTWRRVIDQVGIFDQSLKSFGDFEWGRRVFSAGYRQIYGADVEVKHPARKTWTALRQQAERVAGGVYDYSIKSDDQWIKRHWTFFRLIIMDLIPPVNFAISTLKHPQPMTLKQRLKLPFLLLLLRYTSAAEKMRLKLGGVSKRA
jgi:glycosyltransferase involved in cell wall biosynthesis